MSLKTISPEAAHELITQQGAMLIDIRSLDEHARERIALARHVPMEQLKTKEQLVENSTAIIYHCRSGNRTKLNAALLAACSSCEAYVLEGGLNAWRKAGLPVHIDSSQPLELQRQVQIVAGTLILLGTILGALVSPLFYIVPASFGAGLAFAGMTGFCGLARILLKMPWNRRALKAASTVTG